MNKLLPITPKQQTTLQLIYTYRFLNTKHIQVLLNHKDKRRITKWLKDLTEKGYLVRIYDPTDFIAKSRPAIYYLGLNGVRHLRSLTDEDGEPLYLPGELRKRYKESTRSQSYIDQCLLIADCCISMQQQTNDKKQYEHYVRSEIGDDPEYFDYLDELRPDICFRTKTKDKETSYLLQLFSLTTPKYSTNKALKRYIVHIDEYDYNDKPIALLAFSELRDMIAAKRRALYILRERGAEEELSYYIRFSAYDKIRSDDVTGAIWEEV